MSFKGGKKPTNKESVKNDIAEKVKEIKARQKNWLKERDQHIHRESSEFSRSTSTISRASPQNRNESVLKADSRSTTHSTCSSKSAARSNPQVSSKGRRPSSEKVENTSTTVRSDHLKANAQQRFQQWMKAREMPEGDSQANTITNKTAFDNDFSGVSYKPSSLHSSQGSVTYSGNVPERNLSRNRRELSPEMFDVLADEIVNRVKREMNIKNDVRIDTRRIHSEWGIQKKGDDMDVNDDDGYSESTDNYLESHYCPRCSKIMLPPLNSPMLIIPCGHTFCEQCSNTRGRCMQCKCDIQSVTCNIMLQQIITEFSKRKKPSTPSSSGNIKQSKGYDADHYAEGVNYREEYKTLCTRCEVLNSEAEIISRRVEEMLAEIEAANKQISHIDLEEERVEGQIRHLEAKLVSLRGHREEYKQRCEELETKQFEENSRLALIQETLQSLHQQIEKVQLLAEGNAYHK